MFGESEMSFVNFGANFLVSSCSQSEPRSVKSHFNFHLLSSSCLGIFCSASLSPSLSLWCLALLIPVLTFSRLVCNLFLCCLLHKRRLILIIETVLSCCCLTAFGWKLSLINFCTFEATCSCLYPSHLLSYLDTVFTVSTAGSSAGIDPSFHLASCLLSAPVFPLFCNL